MSAVKIGSITFIVNGYTLNNNVPYFQKAVPSALKLRIGKSNVKIRLWPKNGIFAVQCHRLNEQHDSLFRAMKDDARLTPSEAKIAALALLKTSGLKAGDALEEMPMPHGWEGSWDSTPHISFFEDALRDKFDKRNVITDAAFSALYNKSPVLLSEAFTVYLENHPKGKDKTFQSKQDQHWRKLVLLLGDIAATALSADHPDVLQLRIINEFLKDFSWPQKAPIRLLYSGGPLLGGRVYSRFQSMPKAIRAELTINGEQTVELDFKANHLMMLVALSGLKPPEDPYLTIAHIAGQSRETVKKFINKCIGAGDATKAFNACKRDRVNKELFNKLAADLAPGIRIP